MTRGLILMLTMALVSGCRNSAPAVDPWAALGPRRIPAPATGSIRPVNPDQSYYQSTLQSSQSPVVGKFAGDVTSPPASLGEQPISLRPSGLSQASTSPVGQPAVVPGAGSDGWRSALVINGREQGGETRPASAPGAGTGTVATAIGSTTAVSLRGGEGLIRIVEPSSTVPAHTFVLQPMPVNDATLTAEPERLRVPDNLSRINEQSVVRSAAPVEPRPVQFTAQLPVGSKAIDRDGTVTGPNRASTFGTWRTAPGNVTIRQ